MSHDLGEMPTAGSKRNSIAGSSQMTNIPGSPPVQRPESVIYTTRYASDTIRSTASSRCETFSQQGTLTTRQKFFGGGQITSIPINNEQHELQEVRAYIDDPSPMDNVQPIGDNYMVGNPVEVQTAHITYTPKVDHAILTPNKMYEQSTMQYVQDHQGQPMGDGYYYSPTAPPQSNVSTLSPRDSHLHTSPQDFADDEKFPPPPPQTNTVTIKRPDRSKMLHVPSNESKFKKWFCPAWHGIGLGLALCIELFIGYLFFSTLVTDWWAYWLVVPYGLLLIVSTICTVIALFRHTPHWHLFYVLVHLNVAGFLILLASLFLFAQPSTFFQSLPRVVRSGHQPGPKFLDFQLISTASSVDSQIDLTVLLLSILMYAVAILEIIICLKLILDWRKSEKQKKKLDNSQAVFKCGHDTQFTSMPFGNSGPSYAERTTVV